MCVCVGGVRGGVYVQDVGVGVWIGVWYEGVG